MKESSVVIKILSYLKSLPQTVAFKHHGGLYSKAGVSDIIACIKGRAVFIEVKTPEKRNSATKLQEIFIKSIQDAGGIAFVACSVEDVKEKLI